jgi:hypothetical protein
VVALLLVQQEGALVHVLQQVQAQVWVLLVVALVAEPGV